MRAKLRLEAVLRLFLRFSSKRSTVVECLRRQTLHLCCIFQISVRLYLFVYLDTVFVRLERKTLQMRVVQGVASTHESAYIDVRNRMGTELQR